MKGLMIMKKKNKIWLFALVLLLSSCGTKTPTSTSTSSSSPTTSMPSSTPSSTPSATPPTTSLTPTTSVQREKPRILLENETTELTCKAGEYIRLPKGFARDMEQNDLSSKIAVSLLENDGAELKSGYFLASLAGTYHVLYNVKDHAGLETSFELPVHVSPWYENTYDVESYDQLENFDKNKIYKDDLEKGKDSSLLKENLPSNAKIISNDLAIEGTSLNIDYSLGSGENSAFTLPMLSSYIKPGKWTISFDLKIVRGYGFSDFYVGYKEIGGQSENQQISLDKVGYGETKRITYTGVLNVNSNKNYLFHIFKNNSDNVAISMDNFDIRYEEVSYTFYTPTVEDLHQGVVIDWNDKFLPITSTVPQTVADIESDTIRNALEASDAFGETCLYMYGTGDHNITGIERSIDEDYFDPSMVYTFKFTYYAMSVSAHYIIIIDGTADNVNVASGFLKTGLNEVEVSFQVPKNAKRITFYGTYDMYVGKMEISLTKSSVNARTDTYTPKHEEIIQEQGYTWDYSENNAVDLGGFLYADVDALSSEIKDSIHGLSSFSSQVLKGDFINGGGRKLVSVENVLSLEYTYTLSFDAYCESGRSVLVLLYGNSQIGNHISLQKTAVTGHSNVYHYSVTFTPKNGTNNDFKTIMLYPQYTFTMYIGNITLKGVKS